MFCKAVWILVSGVYGTCNAGSDSCQSESASLLQLKKTKPVLTQLKTVTDDGTEKVTQDGWPGCHCRRTHNCRIWRADNKLWCYVDNNHKDKCGDLQKSKKFWWSELYHSNAACYPEPTPPAPPPPPTPPPAPNCFTRELWSEEKKGWCCANKGLGCPTPTPPPAPNCFTREIWSEEKKGWCCANKGLGCPPPVAEPTPAPTLPPPTPPPPTPPPPTPPPPTPAPTPASCTEPTGVHGQVSQYGPGKGGCQECTCVNGNWECSCVLRTRKEIHDVTDEEFELFSWAVNHLKKDGTWAKLVEVHLLSHRESHGTFEFLYWHRRFMMEAENLLQKAVFDNHPEFSNDNAVACSVALPYWNWAMDKGEDHESVVFHSNRYGGLNLGESRAACVVDGAFGSTFNSKLDWFMYGQHNVSLQCLMRAGRTAIAPDHWTDVKAEIESQDFNGASDFEALSQLIERSFHNSIHGAIGGGGGHMSTMVSPYDPIFYAHHSFVDYLWHHWQSHHVSEADHKEGNITATGLFGTTDAQPNSDFEQSLHLIDDNPNTPHQDFTCVNYAERQSALCPGKPWMDACLQAIAVNSTLRVQLPRVEVTTSTGGKLSDLCSPADESQVRHAKVWLEGLKDMGMMTDEKIDQILAEEAADAKSFDELMPKHVKLDALPEQDRACSRRLCVDAGSVESICDEFFPDLKEIFND